MLAFFLLLHTMVRNVLWLLEIIVDNKEPVAPSLQLQALVGSGNMMMVDSWGLSPGKHTCRATPRE